MSRVKGCEAVYEVAEQWRDRCLADDKSLLWPDEVTWTVENIRRLICAFADKPSQGNTSFFEQLKEQLINEPKPVHRIAADVTAFYSLFPDKEDMLPATKLGNIKQVINWQQEKSLGLESISQVFSDGVAGAGAQYQTQKPQHMAFYLEFAIQVKDQKISPYDALASKQLANELLTKRPAAAGARNILLHLLFPDNFERIASQNHRRQIFEAFKSKVELPEDTDDALSAIRQDLSKQLGSSEIDFYDEQVR